MSFSKAMKFGSAALPFALVAFWIQGGVVYGRAGSRVVREESPEAFYLCCGLASLLGFALLAYAFRKEPIQSPVPTRGKGP